MMNITWSRTFGWGSEEWVKNFWTLYLRNRKCLRLLITMIVASFMMSSKNMMDLSPEIDGVRLANICRYNTSTWWSGMGNTFHANLQLTSCFLPTPHFVHRILRHNLVNILFCTSTFWKPCWRTMQKNHTIFQWSTCHRLFNSLISVLAPDCKRKCMLFLPFEPFERTGFRWQQLPLH